MVHLPPVTCPRSLPSRLVANGHELHGWMEPLERTTTLTFTLPDAAIARQDTLELVVEPNQPEKVAFRRTTFPVVELWLMQEE